MNRIHAPSSTVAAFVGIASTALLVSACTFAAEPGKPETSEASRVQLQQQLEDAQRRLDKAAREVADLSMSLSDEALPRTMVSRGRVQRAMLGVNIGSDDDDDEERRDGVELLSVSPGGAAAEAGLKGGDVLVALNNKALKRDDDGSARSKLLGVMRTVKPGEKVTVKYLRDGKSKTVEVVAKSISDRRFSDAPRGGRVERFEIPNFAIRRAEGFLGSAELVTLTPKLGQYFGTDKGLLVVRAPTDSRLEIEEGDVILDIDGRTPTSPSHALRILSSYQAGEKLNLNVLRKKRRTNIEIVVPEDAPRARVERRLERSGLNVPALQYFPRSIAVTPPALPPAPTLPPLPELAPTPPLPPSPVILALPDREIELEEVY